MALRTKGFSYDTGPASNAARLTVHGGEVLGQALSNAGAAIGAGLAGIGQRREARRREGVQAGLAQQRIDLDERQLQRQELESAYKLLAEDEGSAYLDFQQMQAGSLADPNVMLSPEFKSAETRYEEARSRLESVRGQLMMVGQGEQGGCANGRCGHPQHATFAAPATTQATRSAPQARTQTPTAGLDLNDPYTRKAVAEATEEGLRAGRGSTKRSAVGRVFDNFRQAIEAKRTKMLAEAEIKSNEKAQEQAAKDQADRDAIALEAQERAGLVPQIRQKAAAFGYPDDLLNPDIDLFLQGKGDRLSDYQGVVANMEQHAGRQRTGEADARKAADEKSAREGRVRAFEPLGKKAVEGGAALEDVQRVAEYVQGGGSLGTARSMLGDLAGGKGETPEQATSKVDRAWRYTDEFAEDGGAKERERQLRALGTNTLRSAFPNVGPEVQRFISAELSGRPQASAPAPAAASVGGGPAVAQDTSPDQRALAADAEFRALPPNQQTRENAQAILKKHGLR